MALHMMPNRLCGLRSPIHQLSNTLLRMQRERMTEALLPSLREYTALFGLTAARASRLGPDTLVMHPGPMNRGVEIAGEVADMENSVITDQVANGVAVRMAVLYRLLGQGREALGHNGSVGEVLSDAEGADSDGRRSPTTVEVDKS